MSEPLSYEKALEKNGRIIWTSVGTSMLPLLREKRDVIIIERPSGRIRRYDVPLYKSSDGRYVLHRVLRVKKDGYIICGDNCTKKEYGITDEQIIGVLTGVIRDGKTVKTTDFSYRLYAHLWCDFFYVRVAIIKLRGLFAAALARLFKRKKKND